MNRRSTTKKSPIGKIIGFLIVVAVVISGFFVYNNFLAPLDKTSSTTNTTVVQGTTTVEAPKPSYTVSAEEKKYLANRFKPLTETNSETVAYVYAPGTQLD